MQNRISWRGHYVSPEWLLHIFTVCVILLAAGVSPRLCSASVFGPGLSLAFSAFSLFPEPSLASFALFIFNRVAFSRFLLLLLLYFVCFSSAVLLVSIGDSVLRIVFFFLYILSSSGLGSYSSSSLSPSSSQWVPHFVGNFPSSSVFFHLRCISPCNSRCVFFRHALEIKCNYCYSL